MKSAEERMEENAFRWSGKILIMPNSRLATKMWKMGSTEKKGRGRPRRRWKDTIGRILRERAMDWTSPMELDRDKAVWRSRIKD